ncbi:MAG: ion channel [Actinomycetota bacterium]
MVEPASPHHGRPHPIRHLLRSLLSPHSYGSVLILIAITYALSTVATERWQRSVVLSIQVVTVWIALRVSHARRPVLRFADGVLVIAIVVAVATMFGDDGRTVSAAVFLVAAILYFIAPLSILRHIVQQSDVDQETVLGAIDAYLLVGMFFAYAYQAIGAIQAGPFFEGGIEGSVSQSLFFSFTTLTTTGYGNLVPAANPGQTFAVMEMLIGQLFLVTAVAKVINLWRPTRWRAGQADGEAGEPPATGGGS